MALTMRDAFASQIVRRLNKICAHHMEEVTTIFASTNWTFVKHDQTIRTIIMEPAEVGTKLHSAYPMLNYSQNIVCRH
jgi:hypothetical protein